MFQLAIANQILTTLQVALVEDNNVANFLFEFWREFRMILSLSFPDGFKLIHIVLTIEDDIGQAVVGILIQSLHQVLTYRLMIKVEFFASIANHSQTFAGVIDSSVDICKGVGYFLDVYLMLQGLRSPCEGLEISFLTTVLSCVNLVDSIESAGSLSLIKSMNRRFEIVSQNVGVES